MKLVEPSVPSTPPAPSGPDAAAHYKDPNRPIEYRVADLLGRMTLEEKARQLDMYTGLEALLEREEFDMPPHFGPKDGDIHKPNPEGIFTGNPTHAKADAKLNEAKAARVLGTLGVGFLHDVYPRPKLYNEIQAWVLKSNRHGIPALIFEEGLHGYMSFDQTLFPQSINLSSTWNRELAKKTGAAIGAESRANGVHMILGPVLDLSRDPRWGRVEETFGEDPFLTGALGLSFVQGMQGDSLASESTCIAEPKHFVGHGSPESGLNTAPAHFGEREIRTVMLKSFEPALREGGAMGVMAAYHDIDGLPVTANPWLLNKVLREEWGFPGLVIADASAIRRLELVHRVVETAAEAVQLALNSGVDVQFLDYPNEVYQSAIVEGVKTGKVSTATLDAAVSRVLRAKFMLGLFERPFVDETLDARVRRSPEHLALSQEVARQSMILLKNAGPLLPLSKTLGRVAVIGPNANISRNGCYAEYARENAESGIFEGIKKIVSPGTEVLHAKGDDIAAAVALAQRAEVAILALGEKQGISGENFDRMNLDLPGNQQALLEAVVKTGTPVVLVLLNGRPLALPWAAENVPAILEAWYPAEFGGQAVAETLFGDNNPAGRLSVSFPRHVGQLPVYYNHFPTKRKKYVDGDCAALFPFGHGLSYTSFSYSGLTVSLPADNQGESEITVTVRVSNIGSRDGDEVVQAYVSKPVASVLTPVKALKAFERVPLRAGETSTVTMKIRTRDLALWDAQGRWTVEPGTYVVTVGGSSACGLSAEIKLT
jgi:beta-glucosidase